MTTELNDTIERYDIAGTGPYAFSWRIFDESDLTVRAIQDSTGSPILLTLDTHYTVLGVDDEDGGTVTLTSATATAYASGYTLDIRSNTPQEQGTAIGPYSPRVTEAAIDNLSRQIQDLQRQINNSFRLPDFGNGTDDMTLSTALAANRAGLFTAFDSNGRPTVASGTGTDNSLRTDLANGLTGPGNTLVAIVRTPAEISAGVTPTNYVYQSGWTERYGGGPAVAAATNKTALTNAILANDDIFVGPGTYDNLTISASGKRFHMRAGVTIKIPNGTVALGATTGPALLAVSGDNNIFFQLDIIFNF